ncbi:MAG: Kelch repeat-containing protein [Phycisphaerales bacterium]
MTLSALLAAAVGAVQPEGAANAKPGAPVPPVPSGADAAADAVSVSIGAGSESPQVRIDQTFPIRRHAHCAGAVGPNIYVIGGISNDDAKDFVSRVDCLDTRTGEWTSVAPIPTPRAFAAVAELDGMLYVIGGMSAADQQAGQYSSVVERFDPVANEWKTCAPLTTPRSRLAAAATKTKIYAIAGLTGSDDKPSDANVVDEYDPRLDKWTAGAGLRDPRHGLSAASAGGRIWIAGGYMLKRREPMTSLVHCLTDFGSWRPEPQMSTSRAWFALVGVKGALLAFGNGGGDKPSHPERLEMGARAWKPLSVPDMPGRRFAGVAVGDLVYLLGGEGTGDRFVRVFDARTNSWVGE